MMRTATKERAIQFYRDFGQRLRALRQVRGYTEQDAAATAEVTLRTWRRWEAGCVSQGNSQWTVAFSEKYDVSYAWLLSGKGPMAMSDFRAQMAELKALPPFVAEQMVCGNRPILRLVKSGPAA
jgi:DNA-binding XRE family transcriptional regulator